MLPEWCHKQEIPSCSQIHRRSWRFWCRPEGGRLVTSEPNLCSCRHDRWVSSGAKVGNRSAGQEGWSRYRVSTHNKLDLGERGRAPTSQMSLCQRQPGIPEGVFQWWCYPHRASTGRRKEWINAELATLYSHTATSLWVSHVSLDHFPTTVKLTAFDHRGACIWFFFSYATLYAGCWLYDQALKWYLLHWKCRGITTGPPGPLDTQGSTGAFIWETL